jgi:broad specificity phosphatase PhoE
MKRIVFALLSILLFAAIAFSETAATTVFLVRHAEKSTEPADNPRLNAAGRARALLLARMLSDSGIQAIYTSQYTRTLATAEPLAAKLKLTIQQLDANESEKLAAEILSKHGGQKILVVGHSNTVPVIIHALGGPEMPEIDERQYDNLFILTITASTPPSLLKLKF